MSKSYERLQAYRRQTAYEMKQEGHSLKYIAEFLNCRKEQVSTWIKLHKREIGDRDDA